MDLEGIRKGLETGDMVRPEKTFLVIAMNTRDGYLYYMSEGGNGRPERETQWTRERERAARFDSYEALPRAISNGDAVLREGAFGTNLELGPVYPYDERLTKAPWAVAFKWRTRKW